MLETPAVAKNRGNAREPPEAQEQLRRSARETGNKFGNSETVAIDVETHGNLGKPVGNLGKPAQKISETPEKTCRTPVETAGKQPTGNSPQHLQETLGNPRETLGNSRETLGNRREMCGTHRRLRRTAFLVRQYWGSLIDGSLRA